MRGLSCLAAAALICASVVAEDRQQDIGKPAPRLMPAGWAGTPVSLENLRGNTVVIAFWNGDVAC